ncbi:MAG: hypothetical protein WC400_01110 [Patescibacteria group bacterium]|jgi:hypothetical protein
MIKKQWLVWGLLTVVLLMTLSAASCKRRAVDNENSTDNSVTNVTNSSTDQTDFTAYPGTDAPESGLADPTVIQAQLTRETTEATDFIRLIQPDAVLVLISSKYINSLSNTFGLSTNYYIYSSVSKPDYYFLVNVPRNNLDPMKRFLMPIQDFELDFSVLEIPTQYWKTNYAKALQLAEAQGGASFRSQHKTFEASVILARPAGKHLSWFITYKATDASGAKLQIQVDANSGEVTIV